MPEARNPQQAVADAVIRTIKERRIIVSIAERGLSSPQALSAQDIENVCCFVIDHAECLELNGTG